MASVIRTAGWAGRAGMAGGSLKAPRIYTNTGLTCKSLLRANTIDYFAVL